MAGVPVSNGAAITDTGKCVLLLMGVCVACNEKCGVRTCSSGSGSNRALNSWQAFSLTGVTVLKPPLDVS